MPTRLRTTLVLLLLLGAGCSREPAAAQPTFAHHHHPPHGGTPVVLGDEDYHVELVLDAGAGLLQAYLLDGEMEDFVRSSSSSFEIDARVDGRPVSVSLGAVASPMTGETVGDTSLFEGRADWLRSNPSFDGTIRKLSVRGSVYSDVKFSFPRGNDSH